MEIQLGSEVKDSVTGYKGVAVGRAVFLAGCTRISVQAPVKKDGTLPDPTWFDETLLVVTKEAKLKATAPTGGPRPEAQRGADATR